MPDGKPGPRRPDLTLLLEFVRREIRLRYLGTFSGLGWALIQPVLQLAIYGYVFTTIFAARLPEQEFGGLAFVAFLAVGLWPWTAFAEALTRSITAIQDNAGLLGKVALPRPVLIAAPVIAGFLLHAVGFILVLAVLMAGGWIDWRWQAVAIVPLLLVLAVFTLGLAWLLSALCVFVRDLSHAVGQALMLLFFLTPVLYPRSLVPEPMLPFADANPMALYVGLFRQAVLGVGDHGPGHWLVALVLALLMAALGAWVFRRLSPHFEDFL
jgi:lipopolysaccharide transport system permease protein